MDDARSALEVLVSGSDIACCGVPYAIGDEVTFSLRAYTFTPAPGAAVHYVDDRHADSGDGARDVRGRVEAILAVHERIVPVAGAHHRTNDPSDTIERPVESVPAAEGETPEGYGAADYRVRLRVAADAALPAPVVRDPAELAPDAGRAPAPRIAPLLAEVVADMVARYGDAIAVLSARDDGSVTLQPLRADAAAVRWNGYGDTLSVELERAEWRFGADAEGVSALRELVEAAATGGFQETVEADGSFQAEARTPGGTVRTTRAAAPRVPLGVGGVVLTGATAARLQRARSGRPHPAW